MFHCPVLIKEEKNMKIYFKTIEPIIDDLTMLHIIYDNPDAWGNSACFDGFKKDVPADLWNKYIADIDGAGLGLRIILRRNKKRDDV